MVTAFQPEIFPVSTFYLKQGVKVYACSRVTHFADWIPLTHKTGSSGEAGVEKKRRGGVCGVGDGGLVGGWGGGAEAGKRGGVAVT